MDRDDFILQYNRMIYHPPLRQYYAPGDHYNVGLWSPNTTSQHEACENLVRRMLELIPRRTGRILDVACGLGASAVQLFWRMATGADSEINRASFEETMNGLLTESVTSYLIVAEEKAFDAGS